MLAKFEHIESIPDDPAHWSVNAANSVALARTLVRDRELAMLFRNLATLRSDLQLFDDVEALRWEGPRPEFAELAARLDGRNQSVMRLIQ